MEEKRTFKAMVKSNKQKIITGAVIVAGVIGGVLAVHYFTNNKNGKLAETVVENSEAALNAVNEMVEQITK